MSFKRINKNLKNIPSQAKFNKPRPGSSFTDALRRSKLDVKLEHLNKELRLNAENIGQALS